MSSGWAAHWSAEHEGQPHIHVYGWHSDDNGHWQVCKVGSCGDTTEKQQHTYGDWVINQPTCTSIGTKERTCSLCSHKETIILPITHIYYEWKYDENDHWKQCSVVGCGVVIAESKENHSYGDDNICDVCGYDKTVSYNVVEGNNGSWEIDATDELTFKADGDISLFIGVKIDGSFIDSSFYAVLSGSTIIKLKPEYLATLSVGIHKITVVYTNGEASAYFVITENVGSSHTHMLTPVVAKPATCTEDGNTAYYICTCGKLFKDSAAQTEITDFDSVKITATGHDYKWIIDKAATADVSGEKHEECTKCHHKKATVLIPATGDDHIHNYIEQSVPPTCSDKGYTEHICSCGDTYKDTFVNALDHTDEDEDGVCDVCEYNVGTTTTDPGNKPSDDTTKPEDTNMPSDDVQSPQTGDNSMMWLWVALLFVSGFGVVATTVIGKKKSSAK